MDINKILNSDYLDILFEGRNKQYGGYELRRKYVTRMRNATIVGLGVVALCIATPLIASRLKPKEETKPLVVNTTVTLAEPPPIDPHKPPPPPPPAEPPPPVKPTVKFTPPVIKKDEEVKEDEKPPEQTEMKNVSAGVKTEAGDVNGIDPGIVDKPGTGTGVVAAPPPPQIFTYVAQMPQPSVNIDDYLSKNLHYPQSAIENNISGRVILKFVVNETGNVSDIQVVRGIGGGCDEEAVRVLKAMPPWKPGRNNGTAVKVYYTLPISFKLQ
jgi:periplasmic protein TonB